MKHFLLSTAFPTPKFLSMPAVGIDISDQSLKFAELVHAPAGLTLGRFGTRTIPAGAIASGKIIDATLLASIFKELSKTYGFTFARLGLPEEQVYLFELVVPKTSAIQIRNTIELSLEEYVPIPAAECIFDYTLVSETADGFYIKVAVASRVVIESYTNVLKGAGLIPLSFELEVEASTRAVVKKEDKGTYLIVDFGDKRTGISIVSNNVTLFTSTLDIGGMTLSSMLERGLKVSFEEAERLKKEKGLLRTTDNQEIFSLLLSPISILRDEINKHYIYWHTHPGADGNPRPQVEKIILIGGDANLFGFIEYLTTSMRIPVEEGNVWANITSFDAYVPAIPRAQSLGYATALGLALLDFSYE